MKQLISVIMLAVVAIVCGCRGGVIPIARVYNPHDPMSAENLAKAHPALQTACESVGSCVYINVDCWKHDGKPFWYINVPGASSDDPIANAYGSGDTLDEAAVSFAKSVRTQRAEAAYKKDHPAKEFNITPCDVDCGATK